MLVLDKGKIEVAMTDLMCLRGPVAFDIHSAVDVRGFQEILCCADVLVLAQRTV